MKWLNILGLVFQFVSFWLAAPELLGEKTLKRLEDRLINFVSILPNAILLIGILLFSLTLGINGIMKGIQATEGGITKGDMVNYFIALGLVMLLYVVFLVLYKKIRKWIEIKLAQPLMNSLIESNQIRFTLLRLGAGLFTLGFLLQLTAALLSD